MVQAQFIRDVEAKAEELFLPGRNVSGVFVKGLKVKFSSEDDRGIWLAEINKKFPDAVSAIA